MFAFFESRIHPTATTSGPAGSAPPPSLLGFYWHFVRQTKGLFGMMLVTALAEAQVDTLIPGHRKFKGPGQRPRRAFDGLRRLDFAPVPSPRAVLAGPCTAHQGSWRSSPQG